MNANPHSEFAKQLKSQPRQFSLRELLILTLATSLILAIGVSSRGSRYFDAFSSPWALISLLPVAMILAVGRFRLASRRMLAIASIILYAASLCTPALELRLWSPTVLWGFHAWYTSMVVFPDVIVAFFTLSLPGKDAFAALAYAMGDVANLAYVASIIVFLFGTRTAKGVSWCRRVPRLGAALAATVLLPIALSTDLLTVYPGYGMWVASFLALVVASSWMQPNLQRWPPFV